MIMTKCCISELSNKEVINLCDGKKLGCVSDVQVDICNGKLCAVIVPAEGKGLGLPKGSDIVIPWEKIERIGDDIIIVNIVIPECVLDCEHKSRRKWDLF